MTTSLIARPPVGYIQLYFLLRSFPGSQEDPTPASPQHPILSLSNAPASSPQHILKTQACASPAASPRAADQPSLVPPERGSPQATVPLVGIFQA